MPIQFGGIKHEHYITRTKAGLFGISHMGEIEVKGNEALPFLQKMMTNDVAKLELRKDQYTIMCNEKGNAIDDFIIYVIADSHYLLIVNAANIHKGRFRDYLMIIAKSVNLIFNLKNHNITRILP